MSMSTGPNDYSDWECPCSPRHRPIPHTPVRYHILPLDQGGADIPENEVWLCPTGADNARVFLEAMLRYGILLPRAYRRRFTKYQREVALASYRAITEHQVMEA